MWLNTCRATQPSGVLTRCAISLAEPDCTVRTPMRVKHSRDSRGRQSRKTLSNCNLKPTKCSLKLTSSHLMLAKSNILLLGHLRCSRINHLFSIDSNNIEHVTCYEYLGVYIDENLDLSITHISVNNLLDAWEF